MFIKLYSLKENDTRFLTEVNFYTLSHTKLLENPTPHRLSQRHIPIYLIYGNIHPTPRRNAGTARELTRSQVNPFPPGWGKPAIHGKHMVE